MVKVAAIQMQMGADKSANIAKADAMVREASRNGANIVLIPELFEGYIFAKIWIKNISNGHNRVKITL